MSLKRFAAGILVAGTVAMATATIPGGDAGARGPSPEAEITSGPAATFERRPSFRFQSSAPDATFECGLDGAGYRPCSSPHRTERLGIGRHVLRVRARTEEAGSDPKAAVHRFRVERRRVTFGRSVAGRALRAVRVGDPGAKRTALVVGSIHGDETEGHGIARRLRQEYRGVSGVDIWIVQTINPDGVARNTRKNARGVDLNRNFSYRWSGAEPPSSGYYAGPRPFSEPEARAASRLARRVKPRVTIWYHQPWGAVLVPCRGNAPVEREYARVARMPTSCRGDGLPGTATSWQNHHLPGRAFVVELGAGRLGGAETRRHARAAVEVLKPRR